MTVFNKSIRTTLVMIALLGQLAACDSQEGPAERAGKDIDQAAQTAGEKIEQAGEGIQDAVKGD